METYFDSLRLRMGLGGRFLARLFIYVFYGIMAAATVVLIFAELRWMQSLGLFFILFLGDRLIHINQAEKKLTETSVSGPINIEEYLSPGAATILEKSWERASFIGGDINLWIARQALNQVRVRREIMRMGANWREVEKKVSRLLKGAVKRRLPKKELLPLLERIVKQSHYQALERRGEYIEPEDLFVATTVGSRMRL